MERLKVFSHQLYECRKGVRSVALATLPIDCLEVAQRKLDTAELAYFVCPLNDDKLNLFFGQAECIDVVKLFCHKPLHTLSAEEDFMLGAILGYSICEQCNRYKVMKKRENARRA